MRVTLDGGERILEGTPLEIVQGLRRMAEQWAPSADLAGYVGWSSAQIGGLMCQTLDIETEGGSDEEIAEAYLRALLRCGLAREV